MAVRAAIVQSPLKVISYASQAKSTWMSGRGVGDSGNGSATDLVSLVYSSTYLLNWMN